MRQDRIIFHWFRVSYFPKLGTFATFIIRTLATCSKFIYQIYLETKGLLDI